MLEEKVCDNRTFNWTCNFVYLQDVDVPTVLGQLRSQRMYLVQTVSQYTFVYKTLVQYLNSARLI